MACLILQILGNSDVLISENSTGAEEGYKKLQNSYSEKDIKENLNCLEKDFDEKNIDVDFPLVRQVQDSNQPTETDLLFGFILTNQVEWMKKRSETGDGWKSIVALDGIWWQNILLKWCQQQSIRCYPIQLEVDPKIQNGAADWEGMAEAIELLLRDIIKFENSCIKFYPLIAEGIPIDKIIIQHSSGTPALSSALYLWGIERKLIKNPIEFIYISDQERDNLPHSGNHWQWRLKVPQIWQLIEIQDFSGALTLLDSLHPNYQRLAEILLFLDKSVSLNLEGQNLEGRDSVIERISIALWSEKAFRARSQWLHWNLRIAGALELALFLLLEKRGNGNYQWKKHKLIFTDNSCDQEMGPCGISNIVHPLLSTGEFEYSPRSGSPILLKANQINGSTEESKWADFQKFYISNWKLEKKPQETLGYIAVRNQLYHNLMGDRIDKLLDKKTVELNNQVDDTSHPSQIAVEWLKYIVQLADLCTEVKTRADKYYRYVSELLNLLA